MYKFETGEYFSDGQKWHISATSQDQVIVLNSAYSAIEVKKDQFSIENSASYLKMDLDTNIAAQPSPILTSLTFNRQ